MALLQHWINTRSPVSNGQVGLPKAAVNGIPADTVLFGAPVFKYINDQLN